jgi:hypothetical protein
MSWSVVSRSCDGHICVTGSLETVILSRARDLVEDLTELQRDPTVNNQFEAGDVFRLVRSDI